MKLSITLPTLYPRLLEAAVMSITAYAPDIDYEIVIVSPFEVRGPRIVWVREEQPRGNCAAHAMGFAAATGDVVMPLPDDWLMPPFWAHMLLDRFLAREREMGDKPYAVGGINADVLGTAFGRLYCFTPLMRRGMVERIGGWYSPDYRAHCGDPDIGMRIWAAGGRCEFHEGVRYAAQKRPEGIGESPHKNRTAGIDLRVFVDRWARVFGKGWDLERPHAFLCDLRLEQLAVLPLELRRQILHDHTVNWPDPDLARLAALALKDFVRLRTERELA